MTGKGTNQKASYATMQIIWLAFLFSVVLYFFLAYLITKERLSRPPAPEPNLELFTGIAAVISIVCLIIAYILWKKSPGWVVRKQIDQIKMDSESSGPETKAVHGLGVAQTLMIVVSAFCEICVLCGLLLVFLGAGVLTMLPFAAATLISLVGFRPNKRFIDRVIGKLDSLAGVTVK